MSETEVPSESTAPEPKPHVRAAMEIAVRIAGVFLLVGWCLQIIAPFIGMVLWAFIIAIATDGFYARVCALMGGRRGLAATSVVVLALVLLIVPAVLLTETLISGAHHFAAQIESGEIKVPPPPANVADWPAIGQPLYDAWLLASKNFTEALSRLKPQLQAASVWLLGAAGSAGVGLVQLVGSLIIAGAFLARSEGRSEAVKRFAVRLAGVRGTEFAELATATVRSVVQGIVGVAIIQALLAGLGFIVVGVPAAGLWALLVLVAAVVQLPVAVAMLPPVLLVFSSASTTAAVAFTVWCLFISLLDNVLKPILFGRGVNVPTLVIFIGAIGGMLSMGIIGLFLGAVVLALGYEILGAWMSDADTPKKGESPQTGDEAKAT